MRLNKSFHIYGLKDNFMMIRATFVCIIIFIAQIAQAQSDYAPDFMRSVGKIYVVAAVTLIILVTLLVYMIMIDRKISRLEKRQKNE